MDKTVTRTPTLRRWLRTPAVLLAMTAGLAAMTAGSPTAASAAAAPPDRYAICVPTSCVAPVAASVNGVVTWDANINGFRAQNAGLSLITVLFAQIDNGAVVSTRVVRVPRGAVLPGSMPVSPTTDALRVSLCPGVLDSPLPYCATTTVTR